MTSETLSNETPEQQVAHERELAAKREQWEKQRKAEKEQQERARKQAGLETALRERARLWETYTGSAPSPEQLRSWQEEYITMRAAEEEMEREERRQKAAQENYNF